MAKIGIFQSADFAWQNALTTALEAAGHTVQVMTNVNPASVPPGAIDLGVWLGGGGKVNGAQAQLVYSTQKLPVFTQGLDGPEVLPIQSVTAFYEAQNPANFPVSAQLASPLTAGWTTQPNSCTSWGCPHVTSVATGTVVLAAEVIPPGSPFTQPGTYPMYLQKGGGGLTWLHYQQAAVPSPAFFADLAAYVTANVGVGGPGGGLLACLTTTDCPAGQICQGGFCVPTGGGGTGSGPCTFLGIPCWLAILLGLAGIYVVAQESEKHHHGGPTRHTRTIVRTKRVLVHRTPTLHEASERLIRRRRELHRR